MKRDIPFHKVKDLAIAIVPRQNEDDLWDCYLLNLDKKPIRNVLVSSKGYGKLEGERKKTTTLRHFFEKIEGECAEKIEPIQPQLFDLTNEFWVSFVQEDYMYDKKYVFVKGSISDDYFTRIPFLDRSGVMIR